MQRGETLKSDYAHVPSMLEECWARRPTEVDFIAGCARARGDRLGVPVPLHTAMHRLVKGLEASYVVARRRDRGLRPLPCHGCGLTAALRDRGQPAAPLSRLRPDGRVA